MSAGIIEHNAPFVRGSPADVWATNEGIYLGRTVIGGTDQNRPLGGQERRPLIGREYDVRSTWTEDGGNYLYDGEENIALIAPPGSGKTRKLLLPNLIGLLDWSCVVADPKGELCAHTAVWRAMSSHHRVYVFDPFGVMQENYPNLCARFPEIFKRCGFNLKWTPDLGPPVKV